jgi:alanyl-tRNA synthetase
MTPDEIRSKFIRYFEQHGHLYLPSSPLVVHGDPSVLLTTAGMQQFKTYYTNPSLAPSRRVVTVQRCMRTSDIEEVGDDTHHTFFEMLGNFSFGDRASGAYFKKEAIAFGYEVVTKEYGLPKEKIWATTWAGEPGVPADEETVQLWQDIGLPRSRIVPLNKKPDGTRENFWGPTGDSGPCGPCSEIHVDVLGKCPEGLPDGQCDVGHNCGRFVEVWNLVFNQYFQEKDGTLVPLQDTGIDTGSGLERMAALGSGVRSAYETDLFKPLIEAAERVLDVAYGDDPEVTRILRIIVDHARAVTFLVADGVTPSNEGRGYVARRLLRRAARYGRALGRRTPFLLDIVRATIDRMAPYYPHLRDRQASIERIITQEESRFNETLTAGLERLNAELSRLERTGETVVPGGAVFALYDTFGFPLELTREVAEARGFTLDEAGFRQALEAQRERARGSARFVDSAGVDLPDIPVRFEGYERLVVPGAQVVYLSQEGERANTVVASDTEVILVLDRTSFYAERGGQVGDTGWINGPHGRMRVDTTRPGAGDTILHFGKVVEGTLSEGELVEAVVDQDARRGTMRHHTATHLLHAALRGSLGPEAHQAGSLVAPDRLRFDFSHGEPLTPQLRREIEYRVNAAIRADFPVQIDLLPVNEAMRSGAVALFDEKYGDVVRVLTIGDLSKELCGGTHVQRTGEIGTFVLLGESSVGSGMRRIEALAGEAAERYLTRQLETLEEAARTLNTTRDGVPARVAQLLSEVTELRRRAEAAERKAAQQGLGALLEQAEEIQHPDGAYRVVAAQVDASAAPTMERLREVSDWLRDKLGGPSVLLLSSVTDGRPQFLAMVSPPLTRRGLHAGKLIAEVAQEAGGRAGGRPEMAQGGGGDPAKLDAALARGKRAAANPASG